MEIGKADRRAKGPSESAVEGLECQKVACEYGRVVAKPR